MTPLPTPGESGQHTLKTAGIGIHVLLPGLSMVFRGELGQKGNPNGDHLPVDGSTFFPLPSGFFEVPDIFDPQPHVDFPSKAPVNAKLTRPLLPIIPALMSGCFSSLDTFSLMVSHFWGNQNTSYQPLADPNPLNFLIKAMSNHLFFAAISLWKAMKPENSGKHLPHIAILFSSFQTKIGATALPSHATICLVEFLNPKKKW